jgi:hypothetical protein
MSESVSYLDVLRVYAFDTSKKLRLGVQNDGGYVIAEVGGGGGGGGDCYISAGVSNEESFTRDFLARYSGVCSLD